MAAISSWSGCMTAGCWSAMTRGGSTASRSMPWRPPCIGWEGPGARIGSLVKCWSASFGALINHGDPILRREEGRTHD